MYHAESITDRLRRYVSQIYKTVLISCSEHRLLSTHTLNPSFVVETSKLYTLSCKYFHSEL